MNLKFRQGLVIILKFRHGLVIIVSMKLFVRPNSTCHLNMSSWILLITEMTKQLINFKVKVTRHTSTTRILNSISLLRRMD